MTTTKTEPHPHDHEVVERLLDVLLEERGSAERATPDIELAMHRPRAELRARYPMWLPGAALVLLGVTVVFALAWPSSRVEPASGVSEPMPPPVRVETIEQAEGLPGDTSNVHLRIRTEAALRALGKLRGLRRLDLRDSIAGFADLTNERAALLGHLTSLKEIHLGGFRRVGRLTELATLSRLETLTFEACRLEEATFADLSVLRNLRHLAFDGCSIVERRDLGLDMSGPDGPLRKLAEIRSLRRLQLDRPILDAAALRALAERSEVEELRIRMAMTPESTAQEFEIPVSTEDWKWLAKCRSLRTLGLKYVVVDAELIAELGDAGRIEHLALSDVRGVSGAEVGQSIGRMRSLQILGLDGGDADESTLLGVAATATKSLTGLTVRGDIVTDRVFDVLADLPGLKTLNASHGAITDDGLSAFSARPLTSLWVDGNEGVTARGMRALPATLRLLSADRRQLDPDVLERCAGLRDLRVHLRKTDESRVFLRELASSRLRESLRSLHLFGVTDGTRDWDALLALRALETLDVSYLRGAVDAPVVRALRNRGVQVIEPEPQTPAGTATPVRRGR